MSDKVCRLCRHYKSPGEEMSECGLLVDEESGEPLIVHHDDTCPEFEAKNKRQLEWEIASHEDPDEDDF